VDRDGRALVLDQQRRGGKALGADRGARGGERGGDLRVATPAAGKTQLGAVLAGAGDGRVAENAVDIGERASGHDRERAAELAAQAADQRHQPARRTDQVGSRREVDQRPIDVEEQRPARRRPGRPPPARIPAHA